MQHNILSNFLTFSTTLSSEQWLRALSHLTTMPVTSLEPYQLDYAFIKNRNNIKTTFNHKEKIIKQEFDLTILKFKGWAFIRNKEKGGLVGNPRGSMTISDQSFAEKLTGNFFPGEKTTINQRKIKLQSLLWQNYIIFYTDIPNNRTLLLIQEINANTCFVEGKKAEDLHTSIINRIKIFFEPIVYQIFGNQHCKEQLDKYENKLKELNFVSRPQMKRQIEEKDFYRDKQKCKVIIDFTLLFFSELSEAFTPIDI